MLKRLLPMAIAAGLLGPIAAHAQTNSVTYLGNGAGGFGGPVGNGSFTISGNVTAGNVTFTFSPGSSGFGSSGNDLVIYLDNGAAGYSNTSTFTDNGDNGRTAVSGYEASNSNDGGATTRTQVNFAPGFSASEALEFENSSYDGLFGLAPVGNNSFNYIGGNGPSSTDGPYVVTLSDSQLGVTAGQTFEFVGTLISTSTYRSNETIGTSVTTVDPTNPGAAPNAGYNGTTTFSNFDSYTVAGGQSVSAAPEPSGVAMLLIAAGILGGTLLARRRQIQRDR